MKSPLLLLILLALSGCGNYNPSRSAAEMKAEENARFLCSTFPDLINPFSYGWNESASVKVKMFFDCEKNGYVSVKSFEFIK